MMKAIKIMYYKRTKNHNKFLKIVWLTLPCIGNLTQNLKTRGLCSYKLPCAKMEVVGRLGELDHQASISASSTRRYQIDERDANECCSGGILVD